MTPQEFAQLMKTNQQLGIGPHGDQAHDLLQPASRPPAYTMTSNKAPTEHEEQVALFEWAEASGITELAWMFSIPNGGYRHPATAYKMKSEGQKPGVPDICIAVPMPPYKGAFIELKRSDRSNHATDEQNEWMAHLNAVGYFVATCYGAQEAITAILNYLGIDDVFHAA